MDTSPSLENTLCAALGRSNDAVRVVHPPLGARVVFMVSVPVILCLNTRAAETAT